MDSQIINAAGLVCTVAKEQELNIEQIFSTVAVIIPEFINHQQAADITAASYLSMIQTDLKGYGFSKFTLNLVREIQGEDIKNISSIAKIIKLIIAYQNMRNPISGQGIAKRLHYAVYLEKEINDCYPYESLAKNIKEKIMSMLPSVYNSDYK